MNRLSFLVVAVLMVLSLSACSGGKTMESNQTPTEYPATETPKAVSGADPVTTESENERSSWTSDGEVIVEFEYEKQSGHASNQFAAWVEDADGNYINTLFATKFTVNGGYKNRPDSISRWVAKSELASMEKHEVDAISGATPRQGSQYYTWDLTDKNGNAIQPGQYTVFVEGSLRWKNSVVFSATIEVGDVPNTVQAEANYIYEAADRQDVLTSDSPENAMLTNVRVRYIPGGI